MDRRRLRLCPGLGRPAALAAAAWLAAGAPAEAQSSEPAYFSDRFELFFPEEQDPAAAPAPHQDLGEWTEPQRAAAPAPEPIAEPIAEPASTAVTAAPEPMEPKAAPAPKPASKAAPVVEAKPEPQAAPEPKAAPRPKPKAAAKLAPPKPVASEPAPQPVAVTVPKPMPKPVAAAARSAPAAAEVAPAAVPEPMASPVRAVDAPSAEGAASEMPEPATAASEDAPSAPPTVETMADVEPARAAAPASFADRMGTAMRSSESFWLAAAVGVVSLVLLALQALAAGRARRRLETTFEGTREYIQGQMDQQMKAQADAYEGKIALMRDHVASARKHAAEVRRVAETALAARAQPNGHAGQEGAESEARTLRDFVGGVAHELDGIVESINIAEAARGIFSDEAWDYGEDFPLPSLELHEATLEGTDYADVLPAIRNAYAALAPMNEQMRAGYKIAPASVQDALAQIEAARDLVRSAARREAAAAEPVDWDKAA